MEEDQFDEIWELLSDKYMDIYSPPGTKIRFTANGGYEIEMEEAKEILELGAIYTVKYTSVGQSYSTVVLEEFPHKQFNTCLFDKVE